MAGSKHQTVDGTKTSSKGYVIRQVVAILEPVIGPVAVPWGQRYRRRDVCWLTRRVTLAHDSGHPRANSDYGSGPTRPSVAHCTVR